MPKGPEDLDAGCVVRLVGEDNEHHPGHHSVNDHQPPSLFIGLVTANLGLQRRYASGVTIADGLIEHLPTGWFVGRSTARPL